MSEIIVFAGTTEGYEISRYLADHHITVTACVATEYGSRSLEENDDLHITAGRLTSEEMEALFQTEAPKLIIDATHPYAAVVTENIRTACIHSGYPYLRLLRETGENQENAVYVESMEKAVEYLNQTEGNILVTTGSKELRSFTALNDYKNRVFARVLSLPSVAASCSELGFEGRHLICMQGPFSQEINEAMLRQYDCRYLVTKDTGKAGGFQEKIDAALNCGVTPVIIGRPLKEEGLSLKACKKYLQQQFCFPVTQTVSLVGIGMGARKNLTVEAEEVLTEAELIIGAGRMVDAVALPGQDTLKEYRAPAICDYIHAHPEYEKIAIVLSGDVGFYSGAKKLLDELHKISASNHLLASGCNTIVDRSIQIYCGISSVVYFMSKIGLSWDDARIVSAHGRNCNLISWITREPKTFAILGTSDGVRNLAQKLVYYGMGEVVIHVGECLSYPEEKIFSAKAADLTEYEGNPLSVICILNEAATPAPATHGLADEAFIRGKAPMTKEEVRTISLSKLRLQQDSICYDIGAGTGSVSIEMALRAHQGKVYAIERKSDAVQLLEENKRKFAADHLTIIEGLAPEAMEDLEPPTHAFIGGSAGNLREIIELLLKKNPHVRIVINCITLETVSEALTTIRDLGFTTTDIVQASISRSKTVAHYHMMMGENPIYIITIQNSAK